MRPRHLRQRNGALGLPGASVSVLASVHTCSHALIWSAALAAPVLRRGCEPSRCFIGVLYTSSLSNARAALTSRASAPPCAWPVNKGGSPPSRDRAVRAVSSVRSACSICCVCLDALLLLALQLTACFLSFVVMCSLLAVRARLLHCAQRHRGLRSVPARHVPIADGPDELPALRRRQVSVVGVALSHRGFLVAQE